MEHPVWVLLKPYKYYNAPDGQNLVEKLLSNLKVTLRLGITMGVMDGVFMKALKGRHIIKRIAYWTLPCVSGGILYTTSAFAITHLRGKDDQYNYVYASLTLVPMIYGRTKSALPVIYLTALFMLLSYQFKNHRMVWERYNFRPWWWNHPMMTETYDFRPSNNKL